MNGQCNLPAPPDNLKQFIVSLPSGHLAFVSVSFPMTEDEYDALIGQLQQMKRTMTQDVA